jgi:hypothetical protein
MKNTRLTGEKRKKAAVMAAPRDAFNDAISHTGSRKPMANGSLVLFIIGEEYPAKKRTWVSDSLFGIT